MNNTNPARNKAKTHLAATLDTLAFAPFDQAEFHDKALESRPGLDVFDHKLGYIRRRIVGRDTQKPSLAFLPDGPATIESYDHVIDMLKDDFNILIMELPGFGFSYARSPDALEFEKSARMLAAALSDANLPSLTLVGCCIQALYAARIAEIVPDDVQALIMGQSGDFEAEAKWSRVIDPTTVLSKPVAGQIAFRLKRAEASIDWWLPFCSGPKTPTQALQDTARTVQGKGCCYALASQLQLLAAMEPKPSLAPEQPTAVVWGLSDQSHAATDKRSILNLAPHADYLEREDLAHFPDLEDPDLIASLARKLLSN